MTAFDHCLKRYREPDEDRADRFLRRAARWTGDACDCKGEGGAGDLESAFSHLPATSFANGSVLGNDIGINAQEPDFGIIAVADDACQKHRRCSRDIRDRVGDQTACAGFGQGESLSAFRESAHNDRLHVIIVRSINTAAEFRSGDCFGLGDERPGAGAPGGHAYIHPARSCAVTEFKPARNERCKKGSDGLFDNGFADLGGSQGSTDKIEI